MVVAMRWLRVLLCLAASAGSASAEQQRVLFVGNSFSFVSGGVWTQYQAIAQACVPGLQVSTQFKGDAARTLKEAATDPATVDLVRGGQYEILVLQDQSELAESGDGAVRTLFAPEAKRHGALLGFYETWATPEADGDNLTQGTLLRKHYYDGLANIAKQVGATVAEARAGEAFLEVLKHNGYDWEMPGFRQLLAGDYDHPSYVGLNLVAWVMTHSFNAKRLGPSGCDYNRVPTVHGQSDEDKKTYARIACELAGICARVAVPVPTVPPLCHVGQALQGAWVRKRKLSDVECAQQQPQVQMGGDQSDRCTHLERWVVSGTQVTKTAKGAVEQHMLRVNAYGTLCIIKLLPYYYLRKITPTKVVWNDCEVWTREGHEDVARPDECWCQSTQKWRDGDGDACAAYGPGGPKHNQWHCESPGTERVSMFKSLLAWQSCPGCQRCTASDAGATPARRLAATAEESTEVVV